MLKTIKPRTIDDRHPKVYLENTSYRTSFFRHNPKLLGDISFTIGGVYVDEEIIEAIDFISDLLTKYLKDYTVTISDFNKKETPYQYYIDFDFRKDYGDDEETISEEVKINDIKELTKIFTKIRTEIIS